MLIGSYNANYGRRQLWMYVGALSVFFIGGSVYVLLGVVGRPALRCRWP